MTKKEQRTNSLILAIIALILLLIIAVGYHAPEASTEQKKAFQSYSCSTYTKDHLTSYECDKN